MGNTEKKLIFQPPQLNANNPIKFSKQSNFYFLPIETMLHIISYLPISCVPKLSQVNQAFYLITNSDDLWKELALKYFTLLYNDEKLDEMMTPHCVRNLDIFWKERFFLLWKTKDRYEWVHSKKRVTKEWTPMMPTVDDVHRIVTIGLECVGKSLLFFKLAQKFYLHYNEIYGEERVTEDIYRATNGFQVHVLDIPAKGTLGTYSIKLSWWDIGGGVSIRPLWAHYIYGTEVFVIVIDGLDPRIITLKREFDKMLSSFETKNEPLPEFIFLINKIDEGTCIPVYEVYLALELEKLQTSWYILPVSVKSWDGIDEALNWIVRDW